MDEDPLRFVGFYQGHRMKIAAAQRSEKHFARFFVLHFPQLVIGEDLCQIVIPLRPEVFVLIVLMEVLLVEIQLDPGRIFFTGRRGHFFVDGSSLQQIESLLKGDARAFINVKGLGPVLVRVFRILKQSVIFVEEIHVQ